MRLDLINLDLTQSLGSLTFMVKPVSKFEPELNRAEALHYIYSLSRWQVYFTDQIRIVRLLNKAKLRHLCLTSRSPISSVDNLNEELALPVHGT